MTRRSFFKPTRQQLALIGVARRQIGLSEDAYRDLLREICGTDSAKDIASNQQFDELMTAFAELGFVPRLAGGKTYQPRDEQGRSARQDHRIDQLLRQLGWARDGDYLAGVVRKATGKGHINFCGYDDTGKVIGALQAIVKRQEKETAQ
tara:strand:- start:117 stop:563 length:447 start_codon:yes stop_codon:yes gene_type:complete